MNLGTLIEIVLLTVAVSGFALMAVVEFRIGRRAQRRGAAAGSGDKLG